MKATNIQTNITRTLIILFFAISFQSCNSSYPTQQDTSIKTSINNPEKSEIINNNDVVSEEELEQAAALLLLATAIDDVNNSTNENYDDGNYSYNDENENSYDEGSAMIKDRIETELGSNIVYE